MKRNGAGDSKPRRFTVRVTTRAAEASVEPPDLARGVAWYRIRVRQAPSDGAANDAMLTAFARYHKVAPSRVSIVSGFSSRLKVLEIE